MIAKLDKEYIRLRPFSAFARLTSYVLFQGRPLTTRWRWLNGLLFKQFYVVKKLPQLKKVQKPIFILGTGRSGTTILGKILSIHPVINFLNEPKALWHAIYPDEDLIGSYSQGKAKYRLSADDATPIILHNANRLYGYCLALTGTKRILDKYPEMIFRVSFVQAIFPDAQFIFLVRNGWDTARSIERWSEREGGENSGEVHNWWGVDNRKWRLLVRDIVSSDPELMALQPEIASFTRHEDMAAVEWTTTMREGLRLMSSIPSSFHMVRYEELVSDPRQTLRELFSFCNLPEDEKCLSYAQKVMSPPSSKTSFQLHPAIRSLFLQTMQQLDYPVRTSW